MAPIPGLHFGPDSDVRGMVWQLMRKKALGQGDPSPRYTVHPEQLQLGLSVNKPLSKTGVNTEDLMNEKIDWNRMPMVAELAEATDDVSV